MLDYLNNYADRFALRNVIRFCTQVEAVTARDHTVGGVSGAPGNWQVTYRPKGADETVREPFDAVLVCSGLYRSPAAPHYPGLETFQGRILHSRSYKGPEGFKGKEVLVVGAGSSGADIAVELSQVTSRTTLSVERGAWLIPRYIGGKPYDHQLTRLAAHVPYRTRMRLFQRLLFDEYRRLGVGDPKASMGAVLPAGPLDVLTRRLTPGSEIIQRIASGVIVPKPGVAGLEDGQVVFSDGTRSRADVILLATGYNMGFPFLEGALANPPGNAVDLYRHVFHPDLPGLAFLGLCIVAGSVIPVIELQARWAARVLAGEAALQGPEQMREEIRVRRSRAQAIGGHPMRVQLLEYMDVLAAEIGAKPNLARHPALAWQLLTGAPSPAQYRLDGPGQWKNAGQAVRDANRRPGARG